ncbi:DUF2288 domain-containing protein [Bdellovibrionota bacterium FG-1]
MHDVKLIREGLIKELDHAPWVWLGRHAERDVIIIVAAALQVLDVGVEIACDHTEVVSQWVQSGLLTKPTKEQLATWTAEPLRKFWTLVVQPYVLIQEIQI